MQSKFLLGLWGLVFLLTGCQEPTQPPVPTNSNIVTVIGAVHGQHKSSERYSLDVLRKAITTFKPDIVLVELPPDRFDEASKNFKQYGEVRESRADDFPELTDVIFPLREEMGFTMIPVAAWTQEIADNRRAKEAELESDPARKGDWAAYETAKAEYNKAVKGRSDDPEFIHSDAYDEAVKARQETYQKLFGDDLGAGGWSAINKAHIAMMNKALDEQSGNKKRILILYGAWHKYKILEALEAKKDITIFDARSLF